MQNLQNVTSTNTRKNIYYVVTPRCAAAAVVSAVVLRRPTQEYTHPYSMMRRRLPTAGIEVARHCHQLLVIRCASEASLSFLHFPRKKKTLHNGSYEHRVPKIKNKHYSVPGIFVCVGVCVWFNIVIGDLGRPYSTHTAPMPVLMGSVHAHILTKPSCAGFAVIRFELIEPGAATCV